MLSFLPESAFLQMVFHKNHLTMLTNGPSMLAQLTCCWNSGFHWFLRIPLQQDPTDQDTLTPGTFEDFHINREPESQRDKCLHVYLHFIDTISRIRETTMDWQCICWALTVCQEKTYKMELAHRPVGEVREIHTYRPKKWKVQSVP